MRRSARILSGRWSLAGGGLSRHRRSLHVRRSFRPTCSRRGSVTAAQPGSTLTRISSYFHSSMEDSELFALVDEARLLYKANAGSSWLVAPAAPSTVLRRPPQVPRIPTAHCDCRIESIASRVSHENPLSAVCGGRLAERRLIPCVVDCVLPNSSLATHGLASAMSRHY